MRSFIALELSQEVVANIVNLQSELPANGLKLVEKENLHVTLKFLGDIEENAVEKITKIIKECSVKPFKVSLSSVGAFPSPKFIRVIWVGIQSSELNNLGLCLNEKLSTLGFPSESFTPHLTIARVKGKVNVNQFLIKHESTALGECEITKIKLKKSTLAQNGPVYEDIYLRELK